MKTAIQISDDILALGDILDSEDIDFDSPEVQKIICDWSLENEENLRNKSDNIAALINQWKANSNIQKQEIDRLTRSAKRNQNNARRLSEYLMYVMKKIGLSKIETDRFNISVQKSGGIVGMEIPEDAFVLPPQYREERVVCEARKEAIRRALENGEIIEGCTLKERSETLRIT